MSSKSKSYPKVCIAIMAKNEEDRIKNTLDSTFTIAHEVYFYDTGSTDKTLSIVKEWSEEYHIPVYIKTGEWDKNFAKHRNVLLQWIDDEFTGDFVIMLDANDEIQGHKSLKAWLKQEFTNKGETGSYLTHQRWLTGNTIDYWNVRVIKPRCGFRYKRRIHEVLVKDDGSVHRDYNHGKLPEDVILFQDRSYDQHKTQNRLDDDIEALLLDLSEDPTDTRTLYYLAQTYFSKNDNENAYKYYSERIKYEGYKEEVFHSYMNLGIICTKMDKPFNEVVGWFLIAHKYWKRAEPCTYLANYCLKNNEFQLGLMFSNEACAAGYPGSANEPVDQNIYLYQRFLVKAIICCRLDLLDEADHAIGFAYDNVPDNEQVKGIYEAIQRKLKDRQDELNKESDKSEGSDAKSEESDAKSEWIAKWKKAFILGAGENVKVGPKVIDKMAESAYNKIFKGRRA